MITALIFGFFLLFFAGLAVGAAFLYFGSYWYELLDDDVFDGVFDDLDESESQI